MIISHEMKKLVLLTIFLSLTMQCLKTKRYLFALQFENLHKKSSVLHQYFEKIFLSLDHVILTTSSYHYHLLLGASIIVFHFFSLVPCKYLILPKEKEFLKASHKICLNNSSNIVMWIILNDVIHNDLGVTVKKIYFLFML